MIGRLFMTEGIAFRWSVTCKIITVRQIGIYLTVDQTLQIMQYLLSATFIGLSIFDSQSVVS